MSGVSGMTVTKPTITTLTVNWNPAGGNVQGYKIIYVPVDGGLEIVVRASSSNAAAIIGFQAKVSNCMDLKLPSFKCHLKLKQGF